MYLRKRYRREYILNEPISLNVKEAYKGIRTNVEFALEKESCKKIMVGGPDIGVGSTMTCLNLAVSFAQAGARVLVIDGDLRSPQLHLILDGETLLGLTDLLLENSKKEQVIQKSNYDNLDFISVGSKVLNPSELLNLVKMREIMQELEQHYEYIFVNVPPINMVVDGRIVANQMDGVIMVVKQNETTYKDMENMINHLKKANAPILGAVINSCRVSRSEKHKYKIYSKMINCK